MNTATRTTVAALLLAVPVAAELAAPAWGDTLTGELTFALTQVVGWVLVASVIRTLAPVLPARGGRVGVRMLVAGALFEVAFALAYGVLVLVGADPEMTFLLFSVGLLLVTVGGITAGVSGMRHGRVGVGAALVAVVLLGLLALAIGDTWLHDLFLLSHYAGWVVVGWMMRPTTAEPEAAAQQARRASVDH